MAWFVLQKLLTKPEALLVSSHKPHLQLRLVQYKSNKHVPADEGKRGEEPVGLDVEAEHELEVGRPVGEEREGAEAARHVSHHEGQERH